MARGDHNTTDPNKRLTLKQKKFAQEYVKNKGNGVQAALNSYDADYESAKSISNQNRNNPAVREEIKRVLDKSGLSLDNVGDKLLKAIDSGLGVKARNSDSIQALNMILKLHNAYPAKKSTKISYAFRQSSVIKKNVDELVKESKQVSEKSATLINDLGL